MSVFNLIGTSLFTLPLIIEGATEKVFEFMMPLKSIYNKNLSFIEQKCICQHRRKVERGKKVKMAFLLLKNCSVFLFRGDLCKFM